MDFYFPGKGRSGDKAPRKFIAEDYHPLLLKELKKLRKAAEEADDSTTQALAEDNIAKYEKEIWMLNQTIA